MPSLNTVLLLENPETSIALGNFIIAITKAATKKEIYTSLAKHLPELLPANRCSVTLLNSSRTSLEIFTLHGGIGKTGNIFTYKDRQKKRIQSALQELFQSTQEKMLSAPLFRALR